jgi:hypothetical protein
VGISDQSSIGLERNSERHAMGKWATSGIANYRHLAISGSRRVQASEVSAEGGGPGVRLKKIFEGVNYVVRNCVAECKHAEQARKPKDHNGPLSCENAAADA